MDSIKLQQMACDYESTSIIWKQWCRLCGKEDDANENVFIQDETKTFNTALATAIGKYFWVNIKLDDDLSTFICPECNHLVKSLTKFTEHVNKVQTMFCLLQTSEADSEADLLRIKKQLGISDVSWRVVSDEFAGKITESKENIDETENSQDKNDFEETREIEVNTNSMDGTEGYEAEEYEYVDEEIEKNFKGFPDDIEEDVEKEMIENNSSVDEDLYRQLKYDRTESECSKESNEKQSILSDEQLSSENDKFNENNFKNIKKRGRPLKSANTNDSEKSTRTKMRRFQSEYEYHCELCNKVYKFQSVFRKHMMDFHNIEANVPEFVCDKCSKVLPTEKQWLNHLRTHLPLQEKLDIPCPYCDRKFSKVAVMRQHVRGIHQNLKPYICDECGRSLKTMAALNEHKLVHTNDCPYECEVCRKRFKNKARLRVHMDTHKETAYVCSECGMTLNTRRTLKMHMLVHTDLKQFKCDFCRAAFKRSKALKNHLILHTGMRPYKCPFCDKTFSNGSNCRSHKKKIHPEELAAEEAQGKRSETVVVPKLDELRSCSNIIENPRKVQRYSGGLPPHMRALLIEADERKKQKELTKDTATDNLTVEIQNCEMDEVGEVIYEIIGEVPEA